MHRFIVFQYGKVGSTSLVSALNKLPHVEAYQSHFLGEQAFAQMLRRLITPDLSDYFFEHSSGQLLENLRIYRHYLRRNYSDDRLTVMTIAREPFDWFQSAIIQDIRGHVETFQNMLQKRNIPVSSEREAIDQGLRIVFEKLLEAVEFYGSVDKMCQGDRYPDLQEGIDHADYEDFRSFMFFLNIFLRPHLWYGTIFVNAFDVRVDELEPMDCDAYKGTRDWGEIYLLKYESMQQTADLVLQDLGYDNGFLLEHINKSAEKQFSTEVSTAFDTDTARKLRELTHSTMTRSLGYV